MFIPYQELLGNFTTVEPSYGVLLLFMTITQLTILLFQIAIDFLIKINAKKSTNVL